MPQPRSKIINRGQYDAVLFDLDGVLTDTASLHARCWKHTFDEYLLKRLMQKGEAFRPFDVDTDYMWMGSRVSTAFVTSWRHAASHCPRGTLKILQRPQQCAGSETARMIWSTMRSLRLA